MDDMKFANNNISLHKWSLIGFSRTLLLHEPLRKLQTKLKHNYSNQIWVSSERGKLESPGRPGLPVGNMIAKGKPVGA